MRGDAGNPGGAPGDTPQPRVISASGESDAVAIRSGPARPGVSRPHPRAVVVLPIVVGLFCGSALAEEKNWSITPGISLSETWSDNVAPNSGGYDKSDFVTQTIPQLRATLDGRRVQADLDYRLQNIQYARNNRNSTYQQYLARAGAEVLPEHFFMDAASSLTQRNINTNAVRVNNNYTITDNRTNQLTASVRPSWYQALGANAEALLDYEHGIVNYDDSKVEGTASDSSLDSASLVMNSLSEQRRLSWKVKGQVAHINYDDNAFDDLTFRHTGLLLGYRVLPHLSPLALVGYEDNDFGNNFGSTDPRGAIWALGFRWQPNTRNELEALAGHRFFGNTYRVNWRQRGRYLTSELSYTEELEGETTSALQGVSLMENAGAYPLSSLGVTGDVYLSKTLRATARYRKSKTTLTVTPFYTKREYDSSSQDESDTGIYGAWGWDFAPNTTLNVNLQWDKTDAASGDQNQTFTYSAIQLQHQIGVQSTASLGYSYTRADSNDNQLAYNENAVTAQLIHWFGTPAKKTAPDTTAPRSRRQMREPQF